jgi:hypothetical protein
MNADATQVSLKLPVATAWLFPEYDCADMDDESYADVIVERILERGAWNELRWLFTRYGEPRVREWVCGHGFRLLSKRSFALWRLALDVQDYVAPDWAREAKEMEPW